jgi:hypothetical protein
MLVRLMFRFTTNVTSLPTTCWHDEFASAATTSEASPAAVAGAPNALPRSLRAIRQGCKPLCQAMQLRTWSCGTESVYNLL